MGILEDREEGLRVGTLVGNYDGFQAGRVGDEPLEKERKVRGM